MQKYHDEPKQYKGYLKSALTDHSLSHESEIAQLDVHNPRGSMSFGGEPDDRRRRVWRHAAGSLKNSLNLSTAFRIYSDVL